MNLEVVVGQRRKGVSKVVGRHRKGVSKPLHACSLVPEGTMGTLRIP
jgi:hypothetical protein